MSPNNSLLHRYWFAILSHIGVGVTAYSRTEAESLARESCENFGWRFEPVSVLEDVDVRVLDQNHVVPNMGPPNFHGVWFPCLNI